MVLKLTRKQKIEYYSIVGFILIIPIIMIYFLLQMHFGNYQGKMEEKEIIIAMIPFVFIAFVLYCLRKRQLRFKEIIISLTIEEFKKAIEISSQQLEWVVEKQTDNFMRATRGPDLLGSEMITIHRTKDKIFINCIPNPEYQVSIITFGLRNAHIKTFYEIIFKIKKDIPINEIPEKWTFGDFILRVFGYSFCLLFIGLAVFMLIPNGNYFIGIISGLIILITDLRKIIKKSPASNKQL